MSNPNKIIPPPENILYEDDDAQVILSFDPISLGHVVIVPIEDYKDIDELPKKILDKIMWLAQCYVKLLKVTYHPKGYSIMQNGGDWNDTGQFHLHVFPRYNKEDFGWTYTDDVPTEAEDYPTLQSHLKPKLKAIIHA